MSTLFETTRIKGMTLRNRLVRSATWEGMCAADGEPTAKLDNCYATLAQGGVGLVITGYTFVHPEGKQFIGQMGIHSEAFEPAFKRLTRAVHDHGGAIAMQLVHSGGQSKPDQADRPPVAPSAIAAPLFPEIPTQLTVEEIQGIMNAFADGARRAKAWGFDGVQLHAAHGYLINQFLSPLTNQRNDAYGGSLENRCRFLFQTYRAVRQATGEDYPVMIKLNAMDNMTGGLSTSDATFAATELDKRGIDAIEISTGTVASGDMGPARSKIDAPEKEAYNLPLAGDIKAAVNCPVMVVGGFRSHDVVENAIQHEAMDYVALARPFIREPGLANRWQGGDRSPATCISCNKCFVPGLRGKGIYCMEDKKLARAKAKKTQA